MEEYLASLVAVQALLLATVLVSALAETPSPPALLACWFLGALSEEQLSSETHHSPLH